MRIAASLDDEIWNIGNHKINAMFTKKVNFLRHNLFTPAKQPQNSLFCALEIGEQILFMNHSHINLTVTIFHTAAIKIFKEKLRPIRANKDLSTKAHQGRGQRRHACGMSKTMIRRVYCNFHLFKPIVNIVLSHQIYFQNG